MNIHPSTVVWGVIWLITTSFTFLWVNFWFNYCDWIDLNRKIHENIDVGDRNYAGGLAAFFPIFICLLYPCICLVYQRNMDICHFGQNSHSKQIVDNMGLKF